MPGHPGLGIPAGRQQIVLHGIEDTVAGVIAQTLLHPMAQDIAPALATQGAEPFEGEAPSQPPGRLAERAQILRRPFRQQGLRIRAFRRRAQHAAPIVRPALRQYRQDPVTEEVAIKRR